MMMIPIDFASIPPVSKPPSVAPASGLRIRTFAATALVAALAGAGCAAVGPDYSTPALAVPDSWQSAPADAAPVVNLAAWWDQLGDPVLTGLVNEALQSSPDLRSARARLREARARRDLAGADRFPTVGASVSAARSKTSAETGSGATGELYSAGFDASWEPDVFGGKRRALEASQADLQAAGADLHATQVSLVAEVALNYIEMRSSQARIAIAEANLASQTETLQLTEWRAQAGLVSSLDVEQARANREQTRATLPSLRTSLAEAQHRLAVLLGLAPAALKPRLEKLAPVPAVPDQVAVGIPADILRQRPDVRAAERRLAAETARIGEKEAARYPDFSLSGSIGLEALTPGGLGAGGAATRSLLGSVAATLFDGGRLRRQVEIQNAVQEQALVSYESTVLAALEEVENSLVSLANSRDRGKALASAADAARNAALLASHRYAGGLIDFQTVLDTERSVLTIEDSLKTTEAQSASALVQLYKALGGGWSADASTDTSATYGKS